MPGRDNPAPEGELLLAYGTLMKSEPLHRLLLGRAARVGAGSVGGRLLNLGRYPGLVPGEGRVTGELYRLDDPELLVTLDREEGYNFERRRTDAISSMAVERGHGSTGTGDRAPARP